MDNRLKPNNLPTNDPKIMAHLMGLGLDCTDGHKRITQAEKFSILGGSEQTHENMTETLLRPSKIFLGKVNASKTPPWRRFQILSKK